MLGVIGQKALSPLLNRQILRQKCDTPLGLSMKTKGNLLAGKDTFSYSTLVLWWPPQSHFKGKGEFLLTLPWLQHSFSNFL